MLTEKHYKQIKEELDNCKNPLFFFDDDPDGLCAFLLLYRYLKEGHGFVVKTHPNLDVRSAPKIEQYDADKVFVLDVAVLDQEFIDACKVPLIWIDHHGPIDVTGIKYFNPRLIKKDSNIPTTYLCYKVVQQDLWIAALGCIADYYLPDFIDEFRKKYPDLLNDKKTIGANVEFDPHRLFINAVSVDTDFRLRIVYGTDTMGNNITAGQYSEIMVKFDFLFLKTLSDKILLNLIIATC